MLRSSRHSQPILVNEAAALGRKLVGNTHLCPLPCLQCSSLSELENEEGAESILNQYDFSYTNSHQMPRKRHPTFQSAFVRLYFSHTEGTFSSHSDFTPAFSFSPGKVIVWKAQIPPNVRATELHQHLLDHSQAMAATQQYTWWAVLVENCLPAGLNNCHWQESVFPFCLIW